MLWLRYPAWLQAVLSTWEVSRSLSHLSGHNATPNHIKKGARDLLAMIERMATVCTVCLLDHKLVISSSFRALTMKKPQTVLSTPMVIYLGIAVDYSCFISALTTMSSSSLETFSDMGNDLVVEL